MDSEADFPRGIGEIQRQSRTVLRGTMYPGFGVDVATKPWRLQPTQYERDITRKDERNITATHNLSRLKMDSGVLTRFGPKDQETRVIVGWVSGAQPTEKPSG